MCAATAGRQQVMNGWLPGPSELGKEATLG
jgi:hypothetical protein